MVMWRVPGSLIVPFVSAASTCNTDLRRCPFTSWCPSANDRLIGPTAETASRAGSRPESACLNPARAQTDRPS